MIDYLPEFLQEIKEFKVIMNAEKPFIDDIKDKIKQYIDNQFILTANSVSLNRYENIVGIKSYSSDSIDERRYKLYIRFNEKLPFTLNKLLKQLNTMCGENTCFVYPYYNEYKLVIKLGGNAYLISDEIIKMLDRMIPANILYSIIFFNKHSILSDFMHKSLSCYSHNMLRNNKITG